MRRVKLICFGKLKEPYWRAACAEYEKRLQAYCKLEIIELAPAALPDSPSAAQIEQALAIEAQAAQVKIPKGASVAALCVEGEQRSSEQFAAWLEGQSEIVLLIGSSYGMHEALKKQAQLKLSLSDMTFPHQLARIMLLEQLYRASQIQSGGKYHK
jgi:23S rRNA (pseudouridine1915-N3)-methyltransferase